MMNFLIKFRQKTIILLLLAGALFAQEHNWKLLSEMPMAVKGGQAIVKDTLIYIIGGFTDSTYAYTNQIQIYNPAEDSWQISADTLSAPRYGFSAANYGDEMLLFGGTTDVDSSLEMWNFSGSTSISDSNENFNRQFATAQVYNDDLFVFGGYPPGISYADSAGLPYFFKYALTDSSITYTSDAAFADNKNPVQQMSARVDDNIYVMGGAKNGILQDIHKLNIYNHSWDKLTINLLDERAAGAAVRFYDDNIAVIGGYNEVTQAIATVEQITVYSGEYFDQSLLAELNAPRSELMAVFYDTCLYVFGGKDVLGDCLNSAERLSVEPGATEIMTNSNLPGTFQLFQNYPNPFNPATAISYQLSANSQVELTVYDILGREVKELVNRKQNAGKYSVTFTADELSSGVYFYRLKVGAYEQIRKMVLVR